MMKNDSNETIKASQKGRKDKASKAPKAHSTAWEMSAYDALKVNYLHQGN